MKNSSKIIVLISLCCFLTSCYSVRLRSINGAYQPDPLSTRTDYYRNMAVTELDTVIKIDISSKDFTLLIKETERCKTGKLHTVEFRNTFGGSLLSMVTFGRKRKMKIKYVCMQPTN
ncbi:hypothetical protein [Algibacter sp. L4_22]|uniref:hypothetical protein n=1 Tax=Algibacter sp. L4_22 TaxID=2942477 RepID=UPI00201B7548|nr:hypothetical protein [Algibacter sp. L4_22]MCL5128642.1 hypothetical protein [Algibacter sp. L4_22]